MYRSVPLSDVILLNPRMPKELVVDPLQPVAFVPMAAVSEKGELIGASERSIREVAKGFTYFESGDVLLAKITPCMENGKACLVPSLPYKAGFGSTEFHVLRATERIDPRYLFHCVWNDRFREAAEKNMTGSAGQKRVPSHFITSYKIPLPPLPEQKRIAAILDKADEIRRKREKAIELTDAFLRSVFLEMFDNQQGGNLGRVYLGDVLDVVSGQVDPREQPYCDMPHVGGENIEANSGRISGVQTPQELNLISGKYLFAPHHVLYSKIRPYLNKVSMPGFSGVCSADIYPLAPRTDRLLPAFLVGILRSVEFLSYAEKHSTRTNIPKINRDALLKFEFLLPSMDQQEQYARLVEHSNSLKHKLDTFNIQAAQLQRSLSNAFLCSAAVTTPRATSPAFAEEETRAL